MGGIVGAIVGAGSQKKAAKIQAKATIDAQNKNQAYATDTRNQNVAMFQPQTTYGDNADRVIAGLLGTGGNSTASTDGFKAFRDSAGYQTNLQEGLDAVVANNAARGTFQSGATAKELQDRGAQVNNQFLQQFISNLAGQSNTGTAAKSAIAGQNTSLANTVINGNNTIAQAKGDRAVANANIFNNMLKGIGSAVTSSFTGGF